MVSEFIGQNKNMTMEKGERKSGDLLVYVGGGIRFPPKIGRKAS